MLHKNSRLRNAVPKRADSRLTPLECTMMAAIIAYATRKARIAGKLIPLLR